MVCSLAGLRCCHCGRRSQSGCDPLTWTEQCWHHHRSFHGISQTPKTYQRGDFVKQSLANIASQPWPTDVETQTVALTEQLHQALASPQRPRHKIHKPFIDEHIWSLREEKLTTRKKLSRLHKFHSLRSIRLCSMLWKQSHGASDVLLQQTLNYDNTLLCYQIKPLLQAQVC